MLLDKAKRWCIYSQQWCWTSTITGSSKPSCSSRLQMLWRNNLITSSRITKLTSTSERMHKQTSACWVSLTWLSLMKLTTPFASLELASELKIKRWSWLVSWTLWTVVISCSAAQHSTGWRKRCWSKCLKFQRPIGLTTQACLRSLRTEKSFLISLQAKLLQPLRKHWEQFFKRTGMIQSWSSWRRWRQPL